LTDKSSPAFQIYPRDFEQETADMTSDELAAYIRLYLHLWGNDNVPAGDFRRLAMITRLPIRTLKLSFGRISRCFITVNGSLRHPHLEAQRETQAKYRAAKVEAGKNSGKSRALKAESIKNGANARIATAEDGKNGESISNRARTELEQKAQQSSNTTRTLRTSYSPRVEPTGKAKAPSRRSRVNSATGADAPKPDLKPPRKIDPADVSAWQILKAAYPVVSEHVRLAMTHEDWNKRNKVAAIGLHKAGKTPEQVVSALRFAYTDPEASRFWGQLILLAKLAEVWHRLQKLAAGGDHGLDVAPDFQKL
jgi:uncharacterized protein YdaU (DUF1376 family)